MDANEFWDLIERAQSPRALQGQPLGEAFAAFQRTWGLLHQHGQRDFRRPTDPRVLEATLEQALDGLFAQRIRTFVLDLEQMEVLVAEIDRVWASPAEEKQNVMFLAPEIDSA